MRRVYRLRARLKDILMRRRERRIKGLLALDSADTGYILNMMWLDQPAADYIHCGVSGV